MAAINTSDLAGGAGSSLTTAGVTPSGSDRAVFVATCGSNVGSPNYANAVNLNTSGGTAIDQFIGSDRLMNFSGFRQGGGKSYAEAPSPNSATAMYVGWGSATNSAAVSVAYLTGADQTTPFASETTNSGSLSSTGNATLVYTGLTSGQRVVAALSVFSTIGASVSSIAASGGATTLYSLATGSTEEESTCYAAVLSGVADVDGNLTLQATITCSGGLTLWDVAGRAVNDAAGGGGPVTVGLTGVSATGSVGTVGPVSSTVLTGNTATGSVGTVAPVTSKALTGNSGTGSVGTVASARTKALTGNSATGSVGTVTPTRTVPLTGNTGTGSVGTVVPANTLALTGLTGTGSPGTVGASGAGAATLTGVSGTGSVGTVLPAISKALTGVSGTGSVGTVAPTASKALTGVSGTATVGTVGVNKTVGLTGVSATATPGTVAASSAGTAALTGVTGTGSVGTVGVNKTVGLTGVTATATPGTVAAGGPVTVGLTGVSATATPGSVASARTKALTGVNATGSPGTVVYGASQGAALTGVSATGSPGSVGVNKVVGLTGVSATGTAGTVFGSSLGPQASANQLLLPPVPTATITSRMVAVAAQQLPPFTQFYLIGAMSVSQSATIPAFEQFATLNGGVGAYNNFVVQVSNLATFSQAATATSTRTISTASTFGVFTQTATVAHPTAHVVAAQALPAMGQVATVQALLHLTAGQIILPITQTAATTRIARLVAAQTLPAFGQVAEIPGYAAFVANARTYQPVAQRRGYEPTVEVRTATVRPEVRTNTVS